MKYQDQIATTTILIAYILFPKYASGHTMGPIIASIAIIP